MNGPAWTATARLFAACGAAAAMLAVILGAFGAHGLRSKLSSEMMAIFQTGVQYHLYHSLGLFAVALVAAFLPGSAAVKGAGIAFLAGIAIFSGSLYLLSLTGARWLGAVTPIGGVAFIVGWLLLLIAIGRG